MRAGDFNCLVPNFSQTNGTIRAAFFFFKLCCSNSNSNSSNNNNNNNNPDNIASSLAKTLSKSLKVLNLKQIRCTTTTTITATTTTGARGGAFG
jgi:hypothetical protein